MLKIFVFGSLVSFITDATSSLYSFDSFFIEDNISPHSSANSSFTWSFVPNFVTAFSIAEIL